MRKEAIFDLDLAGERRDVLVELWLSLDVLSFKPAWRPGQQQNSLISDSNFPIPALFILGFPIIYLTAGLEMKSQINAISSIAGIEL